ncbi:MAG: DUF3575 domain-containing protein [Bacteroidales bacterium]|nr:DUF3575 domain-containing protein [Bacteroidales bacterium]
MELTKSMHIKFICILCIAVSCVFCSPRAKAQRLALKTNALEYAVLSPNLTFEARLSPKFSL